MSAYLNESQVVNLSEIIVTISNLTGDESILYPPVLVIPITVIYAIIFLTGVIGNVSTCIVITRNKTMHTATNYYLFSLAISDMLLLVSGLPPEMYRIWSPETYVFGEAFCILQGFAAETSANATVLTITAFTVERYFAICHPFLSHTMSKLSRAIRYIIAIWIIALCLAAPQAIQFGVAYELKNNITYSRCTIVSNFFQHAFEISTFLFFVGPMTLITVLYVLIGIQLRKSRMIAIAEQPSISAGCNNNNNNENNHQESGRRLRNTAAQNRVVNMLIAVVAAFFICWAPFHAQRLLAVYLSNASREAQETTVTIYMILMYTSGILYFLSTTINPVLYNIMSNKFREAFKKTLSDMCRSKHRYYYNNHHLNQPQSSNHNYSVISRNRQPSIRAFQRTGPDTVQRHLNEELLLLQRTSSMNQHQQQQQNRQKQQYQHQQQQKLNILEHNNRIRPNQTVHPRKLSETNQTITTTTLTTIKQNKTDFLLNQHNDNTINDKYLGGIRLKMLRLFNQNTNKPFLKQQNSVDSCNTISNSSLQDVDDIDLSSTDLVKYMEEINEDIA